MDGRQNTGLKTGRNPLLNLVGAGRTNQRLIEDIAIHRR